MGIASLGLGTSVVPPLGKLPSRAVTTYHAPEARDRKNCTKSACSSPRRNSPGGSVHGKKINNSISSEHCAIEDSASNRCMCNSMAIHHRCCHKERKCGSGRQK